MFIMGRKPGKLMILGFLGVLLVAAFVVSGFITFARASGDQDSGFAFASLRHTPYGSVHLQWDPASENLTVTISLVGLAGNSTHPSHIHLGDCDDDGPVLYPLNNVVANAAGDATATTVISGVKGGIPMNGWYVNVHNGPMMATPAQMFPIACGNVQNNNTSLAHVQNVTTFLGATTAANQAAIGIASLSLNNGVLTIFVAVSGLVPGSVHPAHIHAGSCQSQSPGNVVYPLNNVVADANGNGTSVTTIEQVSSIPRDAWYVNVHRSLNLSNQTGFDPIACGNVVH